MTTFAVGLPWPAVSWEEVPWSASEHEAPWIPRRRRSEHSGPYRAAVTPAIAELVVSLPSRIATEVDEATRTLVAFDAWGGADLAPFAAVLLRSESASSSRIENLTASARAIAEADIGQNRRTNAARILANVTAMRTALDIAGPVDATAMLAMHRALLHADLPQAAGRWREEQVWIGGSGLAPHGAAFVPPVPARLTAAVRDLEAFIARTDIPPLAHASLAHAQFETIHPFTDGNGRTGRALLQAMLRSAGITRIVAPPISSGLLARRYAYESALDAFRAGDAAPIVDGICEAAHHATVGGARLVDALHGIRAGWDNLVHARRDSALHRVADLLVRQPVVNADLVAREVEISGVSARTHLRALTDVGILFESTGQTRNRVWRAPAVLDALDAYAESAGRRV